MPRSVKGIRIPVGAETYTIVFKPKLKCDGEEVFGCCRYETQTIEIDSELAEGPMWLTIWHEVMHAVSHENGYERDSNNEAKVEAIGRDMACIALTLLPRKARKR